MKPVNGFDKRPGDINRTGRPKKGQALTDYLNSLTDEEIDGKSQTYKEALALKLWEMAIGGDIAAIKYIFDRIDGKPIQAIDMNTHVDESMVDVLSRLHERRTAEMTAK